MKILHTSDVHLKRVEDERWLGFEEVLRISAAEDVGLLVISGDLFDTKAAAEQLRAPLRSLFASAPARVIVLPGNHDGGALTAGLYFGDRVSVLSDPGSFVDAEGVRVVALPFERIDSEKVMQRLLTLRNSLRPDAVNVLLFHGELLDMIYDCSVYGDEGDAGYMPVRLSYFDGLGFDYVLAGHFHANFEIKPYEGGRFVYSGSPVSITSREQGIRKVNLFTAGGPPGEFPLDTFHYETVDVVLNPLSNEDPLETVRRRLEACHPKAEIRLSVRGFVDLESMDLTERQFEESLDGAAAARGAKIDPQWRNVGTVFEHELFKRFRKRIDESGIDRALAGRMLTMGIEAIMGVLNED
jgi:exonuclease SbcD